MQRMTDEEYHAFLHAGPRTAKLATVRPDGRPHVAPVWFALDGDAILFTTWHTTVKAANLRHAARVCLCLDDERPPYAFVIIEGTAQISDDMAQLQHWARHIAERYMGAERADAYGQRNGVPGELLVRVTPTHIVAQTGIAD
ncbi:MAG: PPOX class F420-dependent oxidoreductase [Chloroflexales bacterium]